MAQWPATCVDTSPMWTTSSAAGSTDADVATAVAADGCVSSFASRLGSDSRLESSSSKSDEIS